LLACLLPCSIDVHKWPAYLCEQMSSTLLL
jgi:hypothetical protein